MSLVRSYAAKLAVLRQRRDALRVSLDVLRAKDELGQSAPWKTLMEQAKGWRAPYERQLLQSQCGEYQQGFAQAWLAACDCFLGAGSVDSAAMQAEHDRLDAQVRMMENRISGNSP